MTESPKPPPRPARTATPPAEPPGALAPGAPRTKPTAAAPPPPPTRLAPAPPSQAAPLREAGVTAPLPPSSLLPPAPPDASSDAPLTREPARDTLAPSSFGVLASQPSAPAPQKVRPARAPLNTLGELEGVSATATLRPPGAVPPPPRTVPQPSPSFEELAEGPPRPPADAPFSLLAGDAAARPFGPRPMAAQPPAALAESSARVEPAAATPSAAARTVDPALESTLDMSGSASKKATQAALIEQTRVAGGAPAAAGRPVSAVPAPGLFIADEPLEPRPKQPAVVAPQGEALTRMRVAVLVLAGLLLMLAGAFVVVFFRRAEASGEPQPAAPSTSARSLPPGCTLALPPSRISATIERTVPISAVVRGDGLLAVGIADTKTSAAGWVYDPVQGEPKGSLSAPPGAGDITHVSAVEPLLVDRALPDFAFARTLSPGLALGVGPAGLLRRGDDGATGLVFPLPAGARVTAPRVASLDATHFVAFRQGGAEGRVMTGWLKADGSAHGELSPVQGAPQTLGTPTAAVLGRRAVTLFSARADKTAPYELYAALAAPGLPAEPARKLALPIEGGGAIAPSLAELAPDRYLLQWTDGTVGQYQVHAVVLGAELTPLGPPLLVSAKGANAGQGTIVATPRAVVSFFIQTTAGHDELWGATLSCR